MENEPFVQEPQHWPRGPMGYMPPPAMAYVPAGAFLRLGFWANTVGIVVNVVGQLLLRDGSVSLFKFTKVGVGGLNEQVGRFPMSEGWILNCCVHVTSVVQEQGRLYTRVHLTAGNTVNSPIIASLISNYTISNYTPSFPNSDNMPSLFNNGFARIRVPTGTTTPVGTDFSIIIASIERWRVFSVRATLATDANVADRRVHLILETFTDEIFDLVCQDVQTAGTTKKYYWLGIGTAWPTQDNCIYTPFPQGIWAVSSGHIRASTTNLQVGDQWTDTKAWVETMQEPEVADALP